MKKKFPKEKLQQAIWEITVGAIAATIGGVLTGIILHLMGII